MLDKYIQLFDEHLSTLLRRFLAREVRAYSHSHFLLRQASRNGFRWNFFQVITLSVGTVSTLLCKFSTCPVPTGVGWPYFFVRFVEFLVYLKLILIFHFIEKIDWITKHNENHISRGSKMWSSNTLF